MQRRIQIMKEMSFASIKLKLGVAKVREQISWAETAMFDAYNSSVKTRELSAHSQK
jgi:hypothetical protein